jgi:hypothetical protein
MTVISLIWQLVALSTFWCVGIYMNSDEGDIFHFLRRLTWRTPQWIYKPVIGCVNCMASLHVIIVMSLYCWLLGPVLMYPWHYLVVYIIVTVITAGTNGIVWVIYNYFHYEEEETKVD